MKKLRIALLSSLGLSLAGAAFGQQAKTTEGIPGFLNPKTHTFHARVAPQVVPDASSAKTYTGTLKYAFTVKLDTSVSSTEALVCVANADVYDGTGTDYYEETSAGTATVSGSTGTCTVSIPYSWSLVDGSTDTVSLSYELVIVPTSSSSVLAEFSRRDHSSELPAIAVPVSGATTNIPISATL
jgi:hypothetical protein